MTEDASSEATRRDDAHKEHRKRVTNALAELDLMFTIGDAPSWGRGWQLIIEGEPKEGAPNAVNIAMIFMGEHHLAAIATVSTGPTPPGKLPALLQLNAFLVTAKVAMDPTGSLAVWASIPLDRLDATSLDEALRAVVTGADKVHEILNG